MIADFETFCTWMYVLVSDLEAQMPNAVSVRPGPPAVCSDAELLTMALVGECYGWDRETELLSQWQAHRDLFPHQPERTRFNRRRRALAERLNHLRRVLLATLDVACDPQCVIDSLPLPVVQFYHAPSASREWVMHAAAFGKCCSKKQTIFGYKLHLLLTLGGVIRDFELAPANVTDVAVGAELLGAQHDLLVLGDKGYVSASLATALQHDCNVTLLTLPRCNQQNQPSPVWRHLFNHLRQLVETVNSQLVQQLHIEVNHAHTFGGLVARLYTKLTAHTLCVALNRLIETPAWLHIKQLVFSI